MAMVKGFSPIIGIMCNTRTFCGQRINYSYQMYAAPLLEHGVLPVLMPAIQCRSEILGLLDHLDGLLLTGSVSNVHPSLYGADATPDHEPFDHDRDCISMPMIRGAVERGVPIFGICRGLQEMNVALGGSLHAKIHKNTDYNAFHNAETLEDEDVLNHYAHDLVLRDDAEMGAGLDDGPLRVNSSHSQAIDTLANGLKVEAEAPDGLIEAVRVEGYPHFAYGVQWHPEFLYCQKDPMSLWLYENFARSAKDYRKSR